MRGTLVAAILLVACSGGPEAHLDSDESATQSGLVVMEAEPLEAPTELAAEPALAQPLPEIEAADQQAVGTASALEALGAEHATVSRQVLASLTVVSSSCGNWSAGDSTMIGAEIEITGDEVTIDLGIYPLLTGTLVDGKVVLSGFLASLPMEPGTSCTVTGNGTVNGATIVGALSETLAGDTSCTTQVQFTL